MPLQSFLTLFAIDAVVLPAELRQRLLGGEHDPPQGLLADLELGSAIQSEDRDGNLAWTLARTGRVRPRAFVAPRWRWVPESGALAALVAPSRGDDPALVVLTGGGGPSPPDRASLPLSPCSVASYVPEHVQLDCESSAGGYVTLVDAHAPGWTATVDGAPAGIVTADFLLRAVAVQPGRHRVEFIYRTPFLRAGMALSALSWLAWLALLVSFRYREPRAVRRTSLANRSGSSAAASSGVTADAAKATYLPRVAMGPSLRSSSNGGQRGPSRSTATSYTERSNTGGRGAPRYRTTMWWKWAKE
jgi:hypothetical protein